MNKNTTIRLGILLTGFFFTALLNNGCGGTPEKSETTTTTTTTTAVEDTPEVARARKVVAALDNYVADFNKGFILNGHPGKTLKFDMSFITQANELNGEADDFFNISWGNDAAGKGRNQATLIKLADNTAVHVNGFNGQAFKNKEGFVVVSIGSSSTQGYYMDGGVPKGLLYDFGTKLAPDAAVDEMVTELGRIGRPIVFVNSIGFAVNDGYTPPDPEIASQEDAAKKEFHPMSLQPGSIFKIIKKVDELKTDGTKTGNKVDAEDTAGTLANRLVTKLAANSIKNAFILRAGKEVKLQNKWTRYLITNLPAFAGNTKGFVGDIGGGGLSIKAVDKLIFDDTANWARAGGNPKDSKDKSDEYSNQDDIVAAYKNGPEPDFIDGTLKANKQKIFDGIQRWMDKAGNSASLGTQTVLPVAIRQTGLLRALYFKSKDIIKAHEQSGAAAAAAKKTTALRVLPGLPADAIAGRIILSPEGLPLAA